MIHPDTELRHAGDVGLGVFATRDIPKGTIVWALDDLDQRLGWHMVQGIAAPLKPMIYRYAYVSSRGDWVLCWDHARFLNHSCRANVLSTGWDFDLALEDIVAGCELTNDYACLNLDEPFECLCGAPECRGTIQAQDFETRAEDWDRRIAQAFTRILDVDQPLWPLVGNPAEVQGAAAFGAPPPSILLHRVADDPAGSAAVRRA